MTAEELLSRLQRVRPCRNGWMASCPAHEDKTPSLSVREQDGKILIHCHAGCSTESIVTALGLEVRDLFSDNNPARRIITEYPYTDLDGKLLYQRVRYEPKDFAFRRPDGNGGFVWNLDGVTPTLYNLPVVKLSSVVIVVEGEKDVETARKHGLAATTSGNAGSWREDFAEFFHGKDVTIIGDADESGRRHAEQVARSLSGRAKKVFLTELPGAKDLSEWFEQGKTCDELTALLMALPEWTPRRSATIQFVPTEEFLSRQSEDKENYLAESLILDGSQTLWQGRPKVGKSHSLLQLAYDAACGLPIFGHFRVPKPVRTAYVELEEPEFVTQARLAAILRAHDGRYPKRGYLSFFSRSDLHRLRMLPYEFLGVRFKDFCSAIKDAGAQLVILVALRRLFHGPMKEQENAEVFNEAMEALRQGTGATITLGHHTRKQPAETHEAKGFGSTMFAAAADAVFDFTKVEDGLRRIDVESRYSVEERFHLEKVVVQDGEVIRFAEAPVGRREQVREILLSRVRAGESVYGAAKAERVPYPTAKRWAANDRLTDLNE